MKFLCIILAIILVTIISWGLFSIWIDFILTADLPTWLKFILLG